VALSNDAAALDLLASAAQSAGRAADDAAVLWLRAGESCCRPLPWAEQTVYVCTVGSADDAECPPLRLKMNGPFALPSVVHTQAKAKVLIKVGPGFDDAAPTAQFQVTVRTAAVRHGHAACGMRPAACNARRQRRPVGPWQVLPALTVQNTLPLSVSLQLSQDRSDRSRGFESALYRARLEMGEAQETTSFAHSGLSRMLLIGRCSDQQQWSTPLEVPLTAAKSERAEPGSGSTITTVRMVLANAGEDVAVCVELRYSTHGAISALNRLTLFAPMWLINHSGICLDHEELLALPPSGEELRQPPPARVAETAATRALCKMVSTVTYQPSPALCTTDQAAFVRFKAPSGSTLAAALNKMVAAATEADSEKLLFAISRSLQSSETTVAPGSTGTSARAPVRELVANTLSSSSNSRLPQDALDCWSSPVQLGSFANGVPVQLGSAELVASLQRADAPVMHFPLPFWSCACVRSQKCV
jgi:hypothetical protein